jgi:hypothetical protein
VQDLFRFSWAVTEAEVSPVGSRSTVYGRLLDVRLDVANCVIAAFHITSAARQRLMAGWLTGSGRGGPSRSVWRWGGACLWIRWGRADAAVGPVQHAPPCGPGG